MTDQKKSQVQDWKVPGYPALSGEVGEAAVNGKLVNFPQVARGDRDFPVPQQSMGLVSFMLFKEPRKLRTGAPVYGFFKLRGNYSDADMCKAKATDIICSQDSRNKIRIAEVGAWLPITDEERDGIVQETVDVKVDAEEKDKLREAAIKDERIKADRIMRELKDREKEVVNARDYNDDPDSLDYYTMKKVAWQRLRETIEIQKRKTLDLEGKLKMTRALLASLDEKHPGYPIEYIEHLNIERRKSGFKDFVSNEEEDKIYAETNPKNSE